MRVGTAALVCTIALALGACREEASDSTSTEPRAVRVIEAQSYPTGRVHRFPGVVEPHQVTRLAFDAGGRLGTVDLAIGQRVAEGEVLMQLDPGDFALRLARAEAALSEARAALRSANDEAARKRKLFARNVASQAALDRATSAQDQARARVDQAERQRDIAGEALADTTLRAPFDGVISAVPAQSFDSVQPGQPVVALYEAGRMRVPILVGYDVVTQLEIGQKVKLHPSLERLPELSGVVAEIGQRSEVVSAFPVLIELTDAGEQVRPGLGVEVRVSLPMPEAAEGIVLPVTALATHLMTAGNLKARRGLVFVVGEANQLEAREIALAGLDGTRLVVASGLEERALVVVAGVPFLRAGQKVRPMEPRP